MATRKGATKTVGGKRYRYNGTKWVQVTNNKASTPKVTSSSKRSTRSTNKPTTSSNSRNTSGSASNRVTYGQKQLPSKTSANSKAARGQRLNTARTQQANQSNVFSKALKKTVAQRAALDKAEKAAKGTRGSGTNTGTRTKGGPIVKSSGGKVVPSKGGALTTSTKSSNPKALPAGNRGGELAGSNRPRRRNVNSNPSSSGTRTGRGGLPPQLRGVLETKGVLPPSKTRGALPPAGPQGTSQPTDGRPKPTRKQTAQSNADAAANGTKNTNVKTGFRAGTNTKPTKRMGPLSGLVEQGLSGLLKPVAKAAGYELGKLGRQALGGGEPTVDKNGNPIKKPVAKGTGLRDANGKPLPAARGAFNSLISSKVPGASTTPPKTTSPKDTPKPDPRASTAPPRGGSGRSTVKPKPVPKKTGSNDSRNAAYIAARSKLNSKSTKAERDKVRDIGMDIHNKTFGKKAKPTKAKPTTKSAAQNLRTGRSPDPTPKKKKKKKEVLPYFGGNGIGRY